MRTLRSMTTRLVAIVLLGLAAADCSEHDASTTVQPGSPTLLRCASGQTQTTTAVVTALGGVLSLGGTSVQIPAGALAIATNLTLTIPQSPYMEIEVTANELTSFVFQQDVSITIDYSRCPAAEAAKTPLSVWHIDPQTKQLLENRGGTDDKSTHRITFSTGHLSGYAVAF
jgi:hypothetical protein